MVLRFAPVITATVSLLGAVIWVADREGLRAAREKTVAIHPVAISQRGSEEDRIALRRSRTISELPANVIFSPVPYVNQKEEEKMAAFQRLGRLDGEKALDYLMAQYGSNPVMMAGLPHAMAFAFAGWMERDLEGALAGFRDFVQVSDGLSAAGRSYFRWKGKDFYSGNF